MNILGLNISHDASLCILNDGEIEIFLKEERLSGFKKDPHIYNVLTKFNEVTGCPVIMNTSFNMAGNPLIETQEQALKCLHDTELDALWFPEIERLVTK